MEIHDLLDSLKDHRLLCEQEIGSRDVLHRFFHMFEIHDDHENLTDSKVFGPPEEENTDTDKTSQNRSNNRDKLNNRTHERNLEITLEFIELIPNSLFFDNRL